MKKIIFVSMLFIMLGSWLAVFAIGQHNNEKYQELLLQAQKYNDNKIYIDAIEYYKKAINMSPRDINNKLKLLDTYKLANMNRAFESYCIKLCEEYPDEEILVAILGDYYVEAGNKEKAIAWYVSNCKSNSDNSIIMSKLDELRDVYKIGFEKFDYASEFFYDCAIYEMNGKKGLLDNKGNILIDAQYDDINAFDKYDSLSLAPVKQQDELFYIDTESNRRMVVNKEYEYISTFSKEGIAVFKKNGKYGYMDRALNEIEYGFDYACSFYNNNATAVKKGLKWAIIDSRMKYITDFIYDDIKINEFDCAVNCGLLFAKKGDKYLLVSTTGDELTIPCYAAVDTFKAYNEYAAIKINDKWGYIDNCGNIVISPIYDEAGSFSCGLAPAKINDLWGYIDADGKIIIKPQFNMARSLNKNGVAAVLKTKWQIISIKYYIGGE